MPVIVQESRTSFWSRIFKSRDSADNKAEAIFANNENMRAVTSKSGGI